MQQTPAGHRWAPRDPSLPRGSSGLGDPREGTPTLAPGVVMGQGQPHSCASLLVRRAQHVGIGGLGGFMGSCCP